ncbi:hypothetical protein DCAR_0727731 [Daucus carota subsp. sativus]|uniref:Glutathione S-transferase n=1 Tax=Daucus carota subsp. sativus TaxID=79200 RepID=A0AAF0XHW3_DAUCS|nr:PREDICTED: glutathione S-transferase U17-like [Daucus carota subsp. sativus]WOH08293.1 hypothetical protein DCAR_0727731 [Daucus carota subsp. sativus]
MASGGVKVLGTPYSPYVNRVQIALNLKSVDFEFIEENLSSKSDLLLKCNPVNRKVPVLIHDENCICESLTIIQYIDETWTTNGYSILPSDPYDRAVARFWSAYFDDKLVPLMRELKSVQKEEKVAAIERIKEAMVLLEEAYEKCSKGKSYFGADNIGYIDIVLGSYMGWIKAMEIVGGMKVMEEAKTPGLLGWIHKFMSNNAVKSVIPETEIFVKLLRARAIAPPKYS